MENYQGELSEIRGGDGPLKVSEVTDRNPIYDGLFKAAEDSNTGFKVGFFDKSGGVLISDKVMNNYKQVKNAYMAPLCRVQTANLNFGLICIKAKHFRAM